MIRSTFESMGTHVEVIARDRERVEATIQLFADLESRLSRFLPSSELSVINQSPSARVELSPLLREVMEVADAMRQKTGGLVDPAVGSAVVAWGYDKTYSAIHDLTSTPATPLPGAWALHGTTLRRRPDVEFDLGGIAKGWAADLAIEQGLADLVSVGGDVRSALPEARVEVEDPGGGNAIGITLGPGGLATSSVAKRHWRVGDDVAHHIIDPATMAPARTPIISASALCPTAAEAEAAAKAVLILGAEGLRWAAAQSWIGAAMAFWHDGSVYATRGWELAA